MKELGKQLKLPVRGHVIGPRQPIVDHAGDWARLSEITDTGAIIVRPDHHVAWRMEKMVSDPKGDLKRALSSVLAL